MLKFIRRNAQAAWVKFIFVAIVIVFIFWGMGGIVRSEKAQAVARVNDTIIDPTDFSRAYNNLLRLYQDLYKDNFRPELLKGLDLKQKAVDQLIRVHLMQQEAERIGLRVTGTEVRDAIVGMSTFQQDGRFNKDFYLRVLRANNITPGDFEESERQELLVDKLQDLILAGVHVSEAEVLDRYHFENEKVNLSFIKLEAAAFTAEVKLTDEEVQAYYDKNTETFREPERVRVEYVLYPPAHFTDKIEVTDADAQQYYDQHISQYEKPAQVHARHILFKLAADASDDQKAQVRKRVEEVLAKAKAGEDFAALAKQYSEDSTASQGGDLGSFPHGKMVKPFEDAAFALAPGQISELVESPFGLHIIKLESKEEARTQPLDEVRAQVVTAVQQEKARELARKQAEGDRTTAAGGQPLAKLAEANGLTVETPSPFAQSETIAGLGRSPEFVGAAFAANAGDAGMTETAKGPVVFRVIEKVAAHVPTLGEIRERVESAVRTEHAAALAKSKAEAVLADLQKNHDVAAVAQANNLTADETGGFTRQTTYLPKIGIAPDLKNAAFQLTSDNPVAPAVYAVSGSSVVAVLKERIPADEEKFKTDKATLLQQAEEHRKAQVMEEFTNYLKARANIEVDQEFLASVADSATPIDTGRRRRR